VPVYGAGQLTPLKAGKAAKNNAKNHKKVQKTIAQKRGNECCHDSWPPLKL
jgi:hypothetical protein